MPTDLPTLDQPNQLRETDRGRFVIDVLLRHWLQITIWVVGSAIVGGIIGGVMHEVRHEYVAETDLVVKPSHWQSPALENLGGNVFGDMTPTAIVNRLDTDALARDVAEALVQDALAQGRAGGGATTDAELDGMAQTVGNGIHIEPFDEKGLLRLRTYSAVSGEDAVRLAELTARGLIDHTQLQRLDEQQQAYALVQQQLDELRVQLDAAESRQWAYREQMGFRTHDQVWVDVERKNNELQDAISMQRELQARIEEIDAELLRNSDQIPDVLGNVTEAVVQDLLEELDDLRQEELELGVIWKDGYPRLEMLQAEIDEKKQAILTAINELKGGAGGSGLWEARQDLYREKVQLKSELMSYRVRAASLQKTVNEFTENLPDLADQSFEYAQLEHETEQLRTQFNTLLEKEFELRTAMRRGTATVERRSAPVLLPASAQRRAPIVAWTLIGGIVGFVCAMGYAMLKEMNDTSIRTTADVPHYLRLEVIGTIPEMRFTRGRGKARKNGAYAVDTNQDRVDASIVTQHDPKSPVSEAYRSLRTNFQFATLHHDPKSIMVTSSVPGEGKTTTAVNFAITLADLGKRVVLVDTDLRRPNVHHTLRMSRDTGLADVLRGQAGLGDVIRETIVENLSVISSGRVPPNPSELIGSDTMTQTIQQLEESFDVVVCDAPSTLVVTDPVVLATHVDAIMLVVAVGRARRETIQRAVSVLETAGTPIAGAVLNGIRATSRHYYYYYYYYDERARERRKRGQTIMPPGLAGHARGDSAS